jgi:hypothetical protein
MPAALISYLTPYVASFLFGVSGSTALVVAATTAVTSALVYGGLAAASLLVSSAFQPAKPEAPKPEDGKFNLKQSVPPLVYVLGRVKKAGDYDLLEEKSGIADHITVFAAHKIEGFVSHWLHDEQVTLDGGGYVTAPVHFGATKVNIQTRLGDAISTAYAGVIARYPTIWTADHRGDGLATVSMFVSSVVSEDLPKTFPSGMPQHSAVIDGHAELIDPRTGLAGYSTNVAVFRHWHLTHPVGGKLALAEMYQPDWAHAADVADDDVVNRSAGTENRYHGGIWFRANNDPVQIGRLMDQAGEMVIYERADGLIGVHAGEFVEPDVRLTADDLLSVNYDANKRRSTNVLAVRGRYTDPAKGYNTADAAIYGNPYDTKDERTKTVENALVQSHNHMARLQKIAYIRANAPRVKLVAHYEPARQMPYRRFVRVNYPPMLEEAIIEIRGRPTLSLRNLTYTFEGIVVPATLYDFDADTEEGAPGASVIPIMREDVPVPTGFDVTILQDDVSGGTMAAYGSGVVDFQSDAFEYEMEWEPTAGGAKASTLAAAGELTIRSSYLADGGQYKFRARTWSGGTASEWTSYVIRTAVADPTAPSIATGVSGTGGVGQFTFAWTAPNSANYAGAKLYLGSTNVFGAATLQATEYGAPNAADSRIITGLTAGTYYGWVVAVNGSGAAATEVATGSKVVT